MSDWTAGYVTDIGYTQGFYRELTPSILAFTPLVAGARGPHANTALTYCELGCGQGFSANLIAAANPQIQVHANDFNPTHVAGARALAAEAGAANVHFSEASFSEYADEPGLPDFDVIALHGIYSWISAENRAHIVEFIRRKLKVGGVVYISYNALPGWSAAAPMRQLLRVHAAQAAGQTPARVEGALAFVEALKGAGANYFRATPGFDERFEKLKTMDRRYLAHEYLNQDWHPFYVSEVNAELQPAKLTFLSTVHLPDRLDAITLNPAQRELVQQLADPILREMLRDYVQNQQFRRDMFIKGPVPLPRAELDEAWLNMRFVLTTPREPDDLKIQATAGEVNLKPEIYDVILNRIAEKPQTVRDLLATGGDLAKLGWPPLREALTLLVGLNRISPCLDAAGDAKRAKRTQAFNAAVMKRALSNGEINFLASPVTGGGVTVGRIEQLLLAARVAKDGDPVGYVQRAFDAGGERLLKDGRAIDDTAESLAELAQRDAHLQTQLPMLKQLGIV